MTTPATMVLDAEQLQSVVQTCQFDSWLGLKVQRLESGSLTMAMPLRQEIIGIPKVNRLHGGAISSLIDATACYLLIALRGKRVSTIDMVVDYLRPAAGDMFATGRLVRMGRTVCVVAVEVADGEGKLVATGRLAIAPLDVPVGQEEQFLKGAGASPRRES